MKIFTSIYKYFYILLCMIVTFLNTQAQDSTMLKTPIASDTTNKKLNMDAVYNRPFLITNKAPIAIGGYLEANTSYVNKNGINDGFNFQMQRVTLFFSSTISKKIKFMSELEFEEGTKEINIENAILDMELHPLVVLRGGIVLNPIGAFNQNHDGPRWDFINRPLSATQIIPATLSNTGFGLYGKYFYQSWAFGYEAYLTNGFNDKLIGNEKNRSSFQEAKEDKEKFVTSNSGLPMFTGKLAIKNRKIGELGISYLTGVYNKWKKNGLVFDEQRTASILAVDFNTDLFNNKLMINAELATAYIQLPAKFSEVYASQQMGTFIDVVGTVYKGNILGWEKAKLNIGCRFEYVDFNMDTFRDTNAKKYDDTFLITPSIAFRPTGSTVIRLNYTLQQEVDLVGNLPKYTGMILFGVSSYF